jgi:SAM-dependent methyltransferase
VTRIVCFLTPARRRGIEYLDEPGVAPLITIRALLDVARSNALFGGARALLRELDRVRRAHAARSFTLLDIGTGVGDLPASVRRAAAAHGVHITTIGVELNAALAYVAAGPELPVVRANALALPFGDASVDIVTCSQMLHHFEDESARALIREMDRVARHHVIITELRRSWVAAATFWLASFPLQFHPVSRHDGAVSVLRGFAGDELATLIRQSVAAAPARHEYWGFRTAASWSPRRGARHGPQVA